MNRLCSKYSVPFPVSDPDEDDVWFGGARQGGAWHGKGF